MPWSALGSETLNSAPQWESEGGGRGTWTILSTSIATLLLCVWTAVHLNIPQHGHVDSRLWQKVGWMLSVLYAPEFIVYPAFQQRIASSRLHKSMTRLLDPLTLQHQKNKPLKWLFRRNQDPTIEERRDEHELQTVAAETTLSRRLHSWTRTHSAFAVMGGIAFDNSANPDEVPLPNGRTRLVVPPRGLEFLAKHYPELIPDISEEAIKDKSKADGLTKAVACVQALYFLAQCISRLATGLPITVLELITAAHCLCALATYILWWYKPFDVMEPVLIPTSDSTAASVCAAMCMRSSIGYWILGNRKPGSKPIRFERLGWMDETIHSGVVEFYSDPNADADNANHPQTSTNASIQEDVLELHPNVPQNGLVMRLAAYGNISKSFYYANPLFSFKQFEDSNYLGDLADATITISPPTLRLCNIARAVIYRHPDELMVPLTEKRDFRFSGGRTGKRWAFCCSRAGDLVVDRMEDFPHATVVSGDVAGDLMRCFAGIALANVCYGGIHLLAWNGPFRTPAEGTLWRISAVSLCIPFVIVPLLASLFSMVAFLARAMNSTLQPDEIQENETEAARSLHVEQQRSILNADAVIEKSADFLFDNLELFVHQLNYSMESRKPLTILLGLARGAVFGMLMIPLLAAIIASFFSVTYSIWIGRPFVLVECFLALPYSPSAVYLTPDWTSYWPHIS